MFEQSYSIAGTGQKSFVCAHSKNHLSPLAAVVHQRNSGGFDDGDNLRVIPFVMYGAASRRDDLLYLGSRRTFGNVRKFPTCKAKSITSVVCRSEMMVLACRLALMPSTGKQHYGGVVMAIAAGLIAFTFADPCIAASSAGGMLFLFSVGRDDQSCQPE